MLCCVTFHPLCEFPDHTTVGTALGPILMVGVSAIGPDISQVLFSPGHQHRYAEVRYLDCSNHGSGPAVGAMGAAQILAWPNSLMYMPTKSTVARPVLAAGALIVCSDVLQMPSLQSQLCCVAMRYLSSSSLVAWLQRGL